MSENRRPSASERFLVVFTDKFMMLWLALAFGGMFGFRYNKLLGAMLCLPSDVLFTTAFVVIAIANRKHKRKDQ